MSEEIKQEANQPEENNSVEIKQEDVKVEENPPEVKSEEISLKEVDSKRLIQLQKLERKNREREERIKKLQDEEISKLSNLKKNKDPLEILKEFDINLSDVNNAFLKEVNKEEAPKIPTAEERLAKLEAELATAKKEKEDLELQNKVNVIVNKTKAIINNGDYELCREYGQEAMDEVHILISKQLELEKVTPSLEEIEKRLPEAVKTIESVYEEQAERLLKLEKIRKKIIPKSEVKKIEEVKVEEVKPSTTTVSTPVKLSDEEKLAILAQRLQNSWDAKKNKR